jgi:ZIP family zinc transporter
LEAAARRPYLCIVRLQIGTMITTDKSAARTPIRSAALAQGAPQRVLQRLLGLALLAAGAAYLVGRGSGWLVGAFSGNSAVGPALLATALTAAATGLGALPVLAARDVSARVQDGMLGFGAGVMLAAAAFSLIVPGVAAGEALTGSRWLAGGIVAAGIAAGAAALLAADRWLPHEHFIGHGAGLRAVTARRIWLFVFAIALHNLPEGLAVGVGFGQADLAKAWALALGIGVQNLPEGLVVALALRTIGYSPAAALAIAAATGLAEPLGGLFGAGIFGVSVAALPLGLAFAAGAMLFVVSHEIIPESHRKGHETHATLGVVTGFVAMMLLDTALAA